MAEWEQAPLVAAEAADSWEDAPLASPGETLQFYVGDIQRQLTTDPTVAGATDRLDLAHYVGERLPFVGGLLAGDQALRVAERANKIKDGTASRLDYLTVAKYLVDQQRLQPAGFTDQVIDIATAIPGFAVEFASTAGAGTAARAATQSAVGSAARGLAGRAAQSALPRAAQVAARAAAMPQQTLRTAAGSSIPEVSVKFDIADDQGFVAALPAAYLDTLIESGSEMSGGALARGASRLVPGKIKALKESIVAAWLAKPGRTTQMLQEFGQQAGWNGLIGEVLEERVGEAARVTTGLQPPEDAAVTNLGAAAIEGDPAVRGSLLEKAGRQLGVEAAAFSIPGAANLAIQAATGDRRQPEPQPARVTNPTRDAEVAALQARLRELETDQQQELEQPAPWESDAALSDMLSPNESKQSQFEIVSPSQTLQTPVSGFTTAKGSTYEVDDQGRTTRTKTPHVGHVKTDVGTKKRSDRTVFVSAEDASEIGMHNSLIVPNGKAIVQIQDDGIYLAQERNGKRTWGRKIAYTTAPEVGKSPVEFWESGANHPGNAITELRSPELPRVDRPSIPEPAGFPAQENTQLQETQLPTPGQTDVQQRIQPANQPAAQAEEKGQEEGRQQVVEPKQHEFSSTQVNLPSDVSAQVRAAGQKISEADLADDGRETEPHVTVKFGLHTNDAADVRKLVENEPPIRVLLGKTSIFPGDEGSADVVKADVESDDLRRINQKIADALPHTDTHPTYQPHVTLGYVKPGTGQKYAGMSDLEGAEIVIDKLVFSDKSRNHIEIPLNGTSGQQTEKVDQAAATEQPASGSIGQNSRGFAVFEDERGVRSYVENGIEITEPVSLVPTRRGMQVSVDKEGRGERFKTVAESGQPPTASQQSEQPQEPSDADQTPAPESKPRVADGPGQPGSDAPAIPGEPSPPRKRRLGDKRPGDRVLPDAGTPAPVVPAGGRDEPQGDGAERASDASEPGVAGGKPADAGGASAPEEVRAVGGERVGLADPDAQNHIIGAADELAVRSEAESLRRNVRAIELLKKLEAEARNATPAEKQELAKYTGWGGLSQVFDRNKGEAMAGNRQSWYRDDNWEKKWGKGYTKLRELLTDDEWIAARDTTINAHYTSKGVIDKMWSLVARLGFNGGRVLEPGAGIGHFAGLAPARFRNRSKFVLVEMDDLSSRMLKKLYPQADVHAAPMEEVRLSPGSVDLVIGNVPFATTGPADAKQRYGQDLNLHNYFLARSLDAVRPGGLVVAISTHNTLDSAQEQRKILAAKGGLIGAIRLPNNAFQDNAKTEVVTDILVFRRPVAGEQLGESYAGTEKIEVGSDSTRINEYFVANPKMVLGKHAFTGSMYRDREYTVEPTPGALADKLTAAIEELPENIYGGLRAQGEITEAVPGESTREGYLRQAPEGVQMALGGEWVTLKPGMPAIEGYPRHLFGKSGIDRAKQYIGVRDAYQKLRETMLDPASSEADVSAGQQALSKAYAAYTQDHGDLNGAKSRLFSGDPDFYRVLSLEDEHVAYDDKSKRLRYWYTKAPVFTKRTLGPRLPPARVETVKDGLWVSLGYRGKVDLDYIGQLTGLTSDIVSHELARQGLAFRDPATQQYILKEQYLGGNVKKKLQEAETAAGDDPAFQGNVDALKAVQPEPVGIAKISVRLGANWIPEDAITLFARQIFKDQRAKAYYGAQGDAWQLDVNRSLVSVRQEWGTERMDGAAILDDALNLRTPRVTDKVPTGEYDDQGRPKYTTVLNEKETAAAKAKLSLMQEEFRKFIDGNQKVADQLEQKYNEVFNAYVDSTYSGAHLDLPGANPDIKLRPYQKNAIWRSLQDGYALLAHAVGAGKTYTMIGTAMEMRRLGLAKRPVLVVQNATLGQFATSFMRMYPNANVLVADKDDLSTSNRQLFLSRITSGDWDAVVMAQSTFDRLANNPETEKAFIEDQLLSLEEAIDDEGGERGGNATVKDLVRARRALQKRMDNLLESEKKNRDKNRLFFEDIEADALFLDEAHAYKKPFFITKLENLVGLNKQASARGVSTMMKVRGIQAKTGGKNVFLATGTPITNTLGEAWHMVNFVAPQVSEDFGVRTFDGFVGAFAQKDTVREMNAGGQWVFKDALVKFTNGPELLHYLRASWDILSPDDLRAYMTEAQSALPSLKGGKVQAVTVDRTVGVEKFMNFLQQVYKKFKELPGKQRRELSYIPAVAYGAAKAAALDIRLVMPNAKEEPGSKVGEAAKLIYDEYQRSTDNKGAQLVFSDVFNPRSMQTLNRFMAGEEVDLAVETSDTLSPDDEATGFLYQDLKKKLLAKGVPESEIAIVGEANTDAKREALFDRVKSGDVRVLIGSSAKMGVGVNVQDKLVALHHLDAPWLPADVEQREGRIIRFGNENKEVSIYRYAMKNTLDAAIFSKTVRKGKFIWQALAGKVEGREFEDPASELTMSVEEQLAAIEGDPLLFEKMELDRQKRELELEKEAFSDQIARSRSTSREYKHELDRIQNINIPAAKKRIEQAEAIQSGTPSVTIGTKTYTEPKMIDAAVKALVESKQREVEKAVKSKDLKPGPPQRYGQPDPQYATDKFKIGGYDAWIIAGTWQEMARSEKDDTKWVPTWINDTKARLVLPGDDVNLYEGDARTGTGLFGATTRFPDVLRTALEQMEAKVEKRTQEIKELDAISEGKWHSQGKLDAIRDRLSQIESEVVAKSEAKSRVRQSADESQPGGLTAFGFLGGGKIEQREDRVPDVARADRPEVERQLAAAYGAQPETILDRIKTLTRDTWRAMTRAQQHIPQDEAHGTMNELFRLAKQHAPKAQDEANRNIAAIVQPLGPQQLQLFTRKLIADNLLAAIDRGEPLRFGFENRAEVAAYQQKLDDAAEETPEVKQALEARQAIVRELVAELIELDLLPAEALERADTYYHQQVLGYLSAAKLGRNPQITKRGFQKKRVEGVEQFDESLNYNTSYLEAEFEWMRDALHQIEKERWLRDLGARYDKKGEVLRFAKEADLDWRQVVRNDPTHAIWQAAPGNVFYQAVGVADHVVEDVLAGLEDTAEVKAEDLRRVLAMGGPQREMVLPVELVEQLNSMQTKPETGDVFGSGLSNMSRDLQRLWRTWTLFSPLRAVAYNLRNLTGDIDPVVGGAAWSLKHVNRALGEMSQYHGIGGRSILNLSPELEAARNYAVIDSSLTASEIPDLKDLPIFRRFYTADKAGVAKLTKSYFDTVKRFSAFRESIARYAAFLYYLDALRSDTLSHYGGARKEVVDRLVTELGPEAAAAHLARNLLGDYGDLTVMGNFLREHVMPFYSWQEVNLKRYPQMFYNAALYGVRAAPESPVKAATLTAAAVAMPFLPWLAIQLFNHLVWPDEEDELSDDERASPHLILGRNQDGSIRILRNTGALGDFLEHFGINTAVARLDEIQAEQMSGTDLLQEMLRDSANKQVQGVRPDLKAVWELPAGKSIYPNVFSPRSVRRDDQAAGYLGLTDVYREARGRLTQDGTRMRPNFAARSLGVTDPRRTALFEVTELRDRYLGKLNQDKPFRGNEYFANMREAGANDDLEAFREARSAFLERGGDYDKFKRSIAALDPISQRLNAADEKAFAEEYLTADQREKLGRARDYARELEVNLWKMWHLSGDTDTPEISGKLRDQQLSEAVTRARSVLASRPKSVTPNEERKGLTLAKKVEAWQSERAAARLSLAESPLGRDAVLSAVRTWIKEELKDEDAEVEKMRRFRQSMGWMKKLGAN